MSDGRSRSLELVTLHGLTWLVAGNAVGLLLATLLLFPRLGSALGPATFGRWVPLHLNFQLYGWCAVAITGLLFRFYLPRANVGRWPALAVGLWSGTLLFGAISWLTGHSDGKIFLEWTGPARVLLAVSLAVLEAALIVAFVRRLRDPAEPRRPWPTAVRGLILLLLAPVPFVMYRAASPDVYPPINPSSGGATGWSLMGSTLAVVVIVLATPLLVGLRSRTSHGSGFYAWALLAAHGVGFALLDHADHSNHEWLQIVALSSLAIWVPVLYRYLGGFHWPTGLLQWLLAFCGWGALLVITGCLTFLPGVLDHLKFTNALVAHAHLAMAGMVTSFNVIVLVAINPDAPYTKLFRDRAAFALWQGGLALLIFVLTLLGFAESVSTELMFRPHASVAVMYGVRWLAGAAMLWGSARWLAASLRHWSAA